MKRTITIIAIIIFLKIALFAYLLIRLSPHIIEDVIKKADNLDNNTNK